MKYIIEFSFHYEDLYDTNQFSVETPLSHANVKNLILAKSQQLEDLKNGVSQRETEGNVVYLAPSRKIENYIDPRGNISQQFRNLATLRFDRGIIIIPLGLLPESLVVMTPDEWFEYCLVGR